MSVKQVVMAAAGALGGGDKLYVEDVFSTYLYTGNGVYSNADYTQDITNGINLADEGGLVWIKQRTGTYNHDLYDTERGTELALNSNQTFGNIVRDFSVTAYNTNGFTLQGKSTVNEIGQNYASWTFRKAPKFFDVVTYTGNGVGSRAISHNLESSPGTVIIKRVSAAENWVIWHRSLDSNKMLTFTANAETGGTIAFDSSLMSSTTFGVNTDSSTNANGSTYVAYLFAHDAGGFGDDGEQNIISCGSYTGNGSSNGPEINLGWEPQFVLIKSANYDTTWWMNDTMRGSTADGQAALLAPNTFAAEVNYTRFGVTSTGFKIRSSQSDVNTSGLTYIYIAIRRPMKTPESGTEVFAASLRTSSPAPGFNSGFPVDMFFFFNKNNVADKILGSRLTGTQYLVTNKTDAEGTISTFKTDYQDGWSSAAGASTTIFSHMFRRAPGFMDVVAYTGTGVARTVNHNLGVAPELMIIKDRTNPYYDWRCYNSTIGPTKYLTPNSTSSATTQVPTVTKWNDTAPTATVFSLGTNATLNGSGDNYIAYLFASCPGVSKVGSYTGTGANLDVDCGFSAGARFVLIKRTDSSGDWYVWDSVRGIVSGNDPYLLLNSTAAEVTSTDYIDPLASGFTVTSSAPAALNASGGSYIFLAIA